MPGNDSFTKVLLHLAGANGGTVITDDNAGGSAKTWTAVGATTSSAQAKFGATSLSCGAGAGYVETPDAADFNFGTGDFAVDAWFYVSGGAGVQRNLFGQADASSTNFSMGGTITGGNVLGFVISSTGNTYSAISGTTAITSPGWNHYGVSRGSGIIKLFLNGIQEGGDLAFAGSIFNSANKFSVGRIGETASNVWNGFIQEFRVSAFNRYPANFTPETAPYDSAVSAFIPYARWSQLGPILAQRSFLGWREAAAGLLIPARPKIWRPACGAFA